MSDSWSETAACMCSHASTAHVAKNLLELPLRAVSEIAAHQALLSLFTEDTDL